MRASFVEASEGDDFDDLAFHHTDEAGQARRAGGQVVFLPGGHGRTIRSVKGAVRAAVIELK